MAKMQLAFDILARDRASQVFDKVGRSADNAGKSTHRFGLVSKLGAAAGAAGLGGLAIQSIKTAASFETTMRQISVATNAPAASIQGLSKLALKMGQDTVFSAQEAGDAMLELAKSGMTEADIRAGALAQTLTLASAGGLDLASAAGYVTSGLALFSLGAEKSADVAAALAGAANASRASVQDMGLALSQVGPGAAQAGLSLQETTGILALFAKNGILGSDAGTSLKTMLARLIPTSTKARDLMGDLGLAFTDANGAIKPVADIAEQLRKRLGKLSDAQRIAALNTIFGSDASRAASILMKEGAKGVVAMTRATSDKTQADRLAKAATEGTAGALSQLEGSIDTAKLALGTALAPLVVKVAGHMTSFANTLGTDVIPTFGRFIDGMEKGTGPGGQFADVLGDVGDAAKGAWSVAKPMLGFIGDHPKLFAEVAKDAVIFAGAMKAISTVKKLPGLGSLGGGAGKGGVLGGITKSAPLPVFVTNQGFGPGVGLGGVAGDAEKVGKATRAGRLARKGALLAAPFGGPAGLVIAANVVLDTKAIKDLKNTVYPLKFNLSVNDAAKEFLAKIQGGSLDDATRAVMQRHFDAVFAGVAEAARTGNAEQLAQALRDTETDLQAHRTQILKAQAKDSKKLELLLTGGLSRTKAYAKAASTDISDSIGTGVGKGVRFAMDRADGLDGKLSRLGQKQVKPKVELNGAASTYDWASRIGVNLDGLGRKHPRPSVDLLDANAQQRLAKITTRLEGLDRTRVTPIVHLTWENTRADLKLAMGNLVKVGAITAAVRNDPDFRASGGPVRAGKTYVVGEREPEFFRPNTSGQILNQRQMREAGGTVTNNYNVTVNEAGHSSEESLIRAMSNITFLYGSA